MKDERFAKTQFAAWVGIIGNVLLALVKGVAAYLSNSKALMADAVHSASEVHKEDARELMKMVERVHGVLRLDEFRAREHGHYVIVDAKIGVDPEITVEEGHAIGKQVKETLIATFPHVEDVFIHVNPYEPDYPYKAPDYEEDYTGKILH